MNNEVIKEAEDKMRAAVEVFVKHLKGVRAGKASIEFLDPVRVEVYGSWQPISSIATVTTPDARSILVQPWDKETAKHIQKAIVEAKLGLNPVIDGNSIRIALPTLSEERRKELAHIAAKYAEDAKVSVRNVRRDSLSALKKDDTIPEDTMRNLSNQLQQSTDKAIKRVEELLAQKQSEITSI